MAGHLCGIECGRYLADENRATSDMMTTTSELYLLVYKLEPFQLANPVLESILLHLGT